MLKTLLWKHFCAHFMMNIQSDKKAVYIENSSFICLTEFESVFSEHTDAFSAAS